MTAHLDSPDPEVRQLTYRAVAHAQQVKPDVWIACDQCRRTLGSLTMTPFGPLGLSWFEHQVTAGVQLILNGVSSEPTERELRKFHEALGHTVTHSGPIGEFEPMGAFVLLAIPPGMAQRYADLLVRCSRHGDAILDRHEAITALRRRRSRWPVTVTAEHYEWVTHWAGDDLSVLYREPGKTSRTEYKF